MARKKLKVVMLGEGRVGKTSLLHRFVHNTFDEECASTTKATMYANTKIEVGDTIADVSIWDTAGQERYHALGPIYYRDAHGAVLAYDITDKESFDKVKVWLKELHQVVGENIHVVVVGNKCDLERERKVVKKEAEEWSAANGAQHFLCSAKLGMRVGDAFTALVQSIIKAQQAAGTLGGGAMSSPSSAGRPMASPPSTRGKGVKIAPTNDDGSGSPSRSTEPKKECAC
jgi:small GTP-binding protein